MTDRPTLPQGHGAEKPPGRGGRSEPAIASPRLLALLARIGTPLSLSGPSPSSVPVAIVSPDAGRDVAPVLARFGCRRDRVRLSPVPFEGGILLYDVGPFDFRELAAAAETAFPLKRLAASRANGEDLLYARIARKHGLAFTAIDRRHRPLPPSAMAPEHVGRIHGMFFELEGSRRFVLAPALEALDAALAALARDPSPRAQPLSVTTPRRLERRLRLFLAGATERTTTRAIADTMPTLSACHCPGPRQRMLIPLATLLMMAGLSMRLASASALTFALSVVIFLGLAVIRVSAWAEALTPEPPPATITDAELPTYSVLVAVYHEAHMMGQLARNLDGLDYPRDRLEILFLVETDDRDTRAAAEAACQGRAHMRVVVVPDGRPRTKPRALAYGLAFSSGDIVTVYDAEDRPDRDQLKRAAAALCGGPAHLACVQARLEIDNARGFLTRQFQIEYACLFSGILPWLSRLDLTLPLGGTSNHFKRAALEITGGWDPFNVTEDADLGVRLTRFGFTCRVLDSATREEAPDRFRVWLRQRRRWIKGWMMTWLVHMRSPRRLFTEMGTVNALVFQLHTAANVLAPLVHPLWLITLAAYLSGALPLPEDGSFVHTLLIAGAGLGLFAGYGGTCCSPAGFWSGAATRR